MSSKKRIRVSYEIITEESAENGDTAENGWIDEEGIDFTPDPDFADETAVGNAVEYLQGEGAVSDGGSDWLNAYGDMDMHDGSVTNKAYHFVEGDWTVEEENAVHQAVRFLS